MIEIFLIVNSSFTGHLHLLPQGQDPSRNHQSITVEGGGPLLILLHPIAQEIADPDHR